MIGIIYKSSYVNLPRWFFPKSYGISLARHQPFSWEVHGPLLLQPDGLLSTSEHWNPKIHHHRNQGKHPKFLVVFWFSTFLYNYKLMVVINTYPREGKIASFSFPDILIYEYFPFQDFSLPIRNHLMTEDKLDDKSFVYAWSCDLVKVLLNSKYKLN